MTNKLEADATSQGRQPATSPGSPGSPGAPDNGGASPTLFPRVLAFVDRVSGGRADWVVRFVSYAIVGGTAAVVNLVCFSLLYYRSPIYFGSDSTAQSLRYIVVFVIAAEISTLTNFAINDRVTFSKLPGHARSWIVRCLRFHLTTVVGTLLTFVISFSLARLGLAALLAQMTAIGIAFLVNFTLHHVFTYRHLRAGGSRNRPLNIDWHGGTIIPDMPTEPGNHRGEQAAAAARQEAPPAGLPLKFSIIIPAHNEEEALRPTISRLHRRLVDEQIPFEILVINDHSSDSTESVLQQLAHEYPGVRSVSNEKPGGFGRAIQTGLEHFSGDAVCIVMADASDDPRDVVTYYRKLQQGYECVFGSRFVAGSKVIDYPRHKLLVNRLANWFINVLFQLRFNDTTNAFKAYRREVIAGVSPVLAPHFNITVELPLKAITRGYTYTTVPINWYNRATGVSKLKIQEMGSRYLFIVLYIWLEKLLTRGDYRRPEETDADRERARARIWAQYETMPHRSVPRSTPIEEIDTLKTSAVHGATGNGHGNGNGAQAPVANGQWPAIQAAPDAGRGVGAAGAAGVASFAVTSRTDVASGGGSGSARIPAWFVWLVSLAVVAVGLAIYARSIHILPLSDDWGILHSDYLGPQSVFLSTGNYHYTPISQGLVYVLYLLFGINPVPYHVVALILFSLSLVLILHLGWKVTGSFTVGALASLLFVLSGRQYEGVVWTVVALFQVLGLALYLGGLLCYLHAQGKQGSRRVWLLIGLYTCMILAVFTYEQEITLIVACMLYRLFVIERGAGWNGRALLARARVWALEFGFPLVFFAAYLGFKYWLGLQTGRSQAPGLSGGLEHTITFTAFGLLEAFTPGVASGRLLALELRFLYPIMTGTSASSALLRAAIVYTPLVAIIIFAKPAYRWLALWSLLVVGSTVLGIGYIASRYQLLFVVPAVILWAGFFVWSAHLLRKGMAFLMIGTRPGGGLRRSLAALSWIPAIAMIAVFGLVGARGALAQVANWQQSSNVASAAIQRLGDLHAVDPSARTLYLVNLPDNVGPVGGRPARIIDRGAYLFQDGAARMVELSLPGRFQTVEYLRTPDYFAIGTPIVMSRAEVDALSNNPTHLVVCFSNQTRQIEPWGPLCT